MKGEESGFERPNNCLSYLLNMAMAKIKVENKEITILRRDFEVYISLTDMTKAKESESSSADIIKNWIRTRFILEFIETWDKKQNSDFKVVEFDHF